MSKPSAYRAALARAKPEAQGLARIRVKVWISGYVAFLLLLLWRIGPEGAFFGLFLSPVLTLLLAWMNGPDQDPTLEALRAATPEPDLWFASPSHGLVALSGRSLHLGGVGVLALDPQAERRCEHVAYVESEHAVVTHEVRRLRTRNGLEADDRRAHWIRLDGSTTPEQARAVAARLDALAGR